MNARSAPDPARSPTLSAASLGAVAGTVAATCGSLLYLLLWWAWNIVWNLTSHGNPVDPITLPDYEGSLILGALGLVWIFIISAAISVPPTLAISAVTGALTGLVLGATRRWQGPVRAWCTGTLLAYLVAMAFNYTLLRSRLDSPLVYEEYLQYFGVPSVIFVLGMGGVSVWLQRRLPAAKNE